MLAHRPAATTDPKLITWEEPSCPLCGRVERDLLTEAADPIPEHGPGMRFAIVRCRHCGLAYTNPRPTPDTIGHFYPNNYAPHRPPSKRTANRAPSAFWSRVFGRPCRERRGVLPGGSAADGYSTSAVAAAVT